MNKSLLTSRGFFSLEGIDGSGKTTQMDLLEKALIKQGYECLRIREPGGSKISENIRELLLNVEFQDKMAIQTELLLYNAARAQVIDELIKPALLANKLVLADRFAWSTYAYQAFGRQLDPSLILELSSLTCGEYFPDYTIILDLPVSESRDRMLLENKKPDRLEAESDLFFERVREGYLDIAKRFPQHAKVLAANQSVEALHQQILSSVLSRLKGD